MPVYLKPASSEYNENWHATIRALIHRATGDVIPIDNGTAGYVRFGGWNLSAAAIRRALCTNPAQRAQLRAEGRRLAASRYNYDQAVRAFLHDVASWAITTTGKR